MSEKRPMEVLDMAHSGMTRCGMAAIGTVAVLVLLAGCGKGSGDLPFGTSEATSATAPDSAVPVDSSGGTVELSEGEAFAQGARIVIPPGALTQEMPIALRAQAGSAGSFVPEPAVMAALVDYSFASADSHPIAGPVAVLANAVPIGPEFILSPDGVQFALPVSLEIPVEVASVPDDAQLLVLLESRDGSVDIVDDVEVTADRVVVSLDHFSAVKLISIPLNVLDVFIFGSDEAALDDAMDLVGPHVDQVSAEVLSVQCDQRDSVTFDPDRLPSYGDLLANLALQDTEPMGGIEYDHLWEMKQWMESIGDQGLPSVSVAEIYNHALGVAGGDVFGALVLAHETLRDDRFEKDYKQLVTDVRGDSTDEVGARYHLFGTAVYGFWYAYQQEHPDLFWSGVASGLGAPPIPTAEEAAAFEEAYVSGDISTDPGEFVVDLAGAQLGRDLYQAVRAAQDSAAADPCPQKPDISTADPGAVSGTVTNAETGEPIAGAIVSLSEPGFETATDPAGTFTLDAVPAGPHDLAASAEGFEETTQPIQVETGETTQTAIALDEAANVLAWDEPRTYVGDGVQTISFAGTIGTCSIPNSSMALTLFPDGRAEAVYNSESPEITVNTVDDVHELVCSNHAPYTVTLEGRHEAGHVVILISTGDLVSFEGDYTADELVISYRFTRDHPDDDVMVQSIVDFDFHLFHPGG